MAGCGDCICCMGGLVAAVAAVHYSPPLASAQEVLSSNAHEDFNSVANAFRKLQQVTLGMLANKPTDATDGCILPHIITSLFGDTPIVFSRGGRPCVDPIDICKLCSGASSSTWELTLSGLPEECGSIAIGDALTPGGHRADLERNLQEKIAHCLGVDVSRIVITNLKEGSLIVEYTVSDLTPQEKRRLLGSKVKDIFSRQFKNLEKLRVSPAALVLHFDLDDFDSQGNKNFASSSTFSVGPPGNQRTYEQPSGWVRYGLKVLGKYSDGDAWLHPFSDSGNWYRAFHGMRDPTSSAKSIMIGGFRPSGPNFPGSKYLYGPGVYVSPCIATSEAYCSNAVAVETKDGRKTFKVAYQVAVKPGCLKENGNIWVVPDPGYVRPYGLLLKEQ